MDSAFATLSIVLLQKKQFVRGLNRFVECSANYICLLFRSQLNEINGIAADTDRKLGIVLRMFLSVQKHISVKNVYVQMMSSFFCISIQ